ncbi:hypothetical protein QF000_002717 [Paraburkholderia atlantica]|uniref:Uncharacterized protein n=1 Tax=Paraburkholderia atlantica TaxID=2654982 RepID=A0A7W8Q9I5_PARAM|nr:hypothetical protein [Paraburkholderia atlantica]
MNVKPMGDSYLQIVSFSGNRVIAHTARTVPTRRSSVAALCRRHAR